jgi:hypothetical protein
MLRLQQNITSVCWREDQRWYRYCNASASVKPGVILAAMQQTLGSQASYPRDSPGNTDERMQLAVDFVF